MISLSIIWLAAAALRAGGLFILWCKAPLHASNASLKKFENLCSISWFPCLCFDLILLHSELGGLYSSWFKALLSCEQHKLENFKIFALLHDFLLYFLTCCCCPQGWGPLYFMVQSTPSCKQCKLENLKIYALLLHAFLVYFLTCCCFPLRWGSCIFHGAKHPFMWATQARKFQFCCTIACFPCLFFDLILLPSRLGGGLYILLCEAPLHVSIVI